MPNVMTGFAAFTASSIMIYLPEMAACRRTLKDRSGYHRVVLLPNPNVLDLLSTEVLMWWQFIKHVLGTCLLLMLFLVCENVLSISYRHRYITGLYLYSVHVGVQNGRKNDKLATVPWVYTVAELSVGPFCVTRPNPTHQLIDPTQPKPTQPNPTHGSTQPMDNSVL